MIAGGRASARPGPNRARPESSRGEYATAVERAGGGDRRRPDARDAGAAAGERRRHGRDGARSRSPARRPTRRARPRSRRSASLRETYVPGGVRAAPAADGPRGRRHGVREGLLRHLRRVHAAHHPGGARAVVPAAHGRVPLDSWCRSKAIIMNLLSVGAAYGLIVLVFQKGGPAIGETIANLLGLPAGGRDRGVAAAVPVLDPVRAVDGLPRLPADADPRGVRQDAATTPTAVAYGLRTTGGIITGAAIIMVAVFAGFAAGRLTSLEQMGFGLAVAVFLDATVVRSILVPSTMRLLGDRNWYLPRLAPVAAEDRRGGPRVATVVVDIPRARRGKQWSKADREASEGVGCSVHGSRARSVRAGSDGSGSGRSRSTRVRWRRSRWTRAAIEALGYRRSGCPRAPAPATSSPHLACCSGATDGLTVCSGIANITAREPEVLAAGVRDPRRRVGRAAGPRDRRRPRVLDRVPRDRVGRPARADARLPRPDGRRDRPAPAHVAACRLLAALGDGMLRLSAERALGAHTYFVPVEHTAHAREVLGPEPVLAVELTAVLETDHALARRESPVGGPAGTWSCRTTRGTCGGSVPATSSRVVAATGSSTRRSRGATSARSRGGCANTSRPAPTTSACSS